jgi:hypothetical protein
MTLAHKENNFRDLIQIPSFISSTVFIKAPFNFTILLCYEQTIHDHFFYFFYHRHVSQMLFNFWGADLL